MRVSRVLLPLLLLVLGLLLGAGPASASTHAVVTDPAAAAAAVSDCSHPPSILHAGTPDQLPRRSDDDPPAPASVPLTAVAVTPAGHDGDALPVQPDRTPAAPSPVEQLCVDRN